MDWWEWTKVGGGIGLACGAAAASAWLAGLVMAPVHPQRQAYAVDGVPSVDLALAQREWPTGGGSAERQRLFGYIAHIEKASVPVAAEVTAPVEAPVDLDTLLASADPGRGRRTAQACMGCHDLNPNGPHGIGPRLWGVAGRAVASHPDFAYSTALKGRGGQWTDEELDRFLAAPARAVPGTKMAFAGVRNPRDRANLLAFLSTLGGAGRSMSPRGDGSAAN